MQHTIKIVSAVAACVLSTMMASGTALAEEQPKVDTDTSHTVHPLSSEVNLPCIPSGKDVQGPDARNYCWIDFSSLPLDGNPHSATIVLPHGGLTMTVKATNSEHAKVQAWDYANGIPGNPAAGRGWNIAYGTGGHSTALRMTKADNGPDDEYKKSVVEFTDVNAYADPNISPDELHTLGDWRLSFVDPEVMSGFTYGGYGYEQTDIESDKPVNLIGGFQTAEGFPMPGIGNNYGVVHDGFGTTHARIGGQFLTGSEGERGNAVMDAEKPGRFKVTFEDWGGDSAIGVGVHLPQLNSYPLRYDLNGGAGAVPNRR
jgi:hypothetical protein